MEPQIPYRTPFQTFTPAASVSSTDENNFDTLTHVRKDLAAAIEKLDHFHAFDLEGTEMNIKAQIKAHQLAYEILMPALDAIDSTIESVNQKYKERING